MTQQALPRPLEDVTVLDLTLALAGPFATLLLAGLGARVIKIENPIHGDHSRSNAPYLGPDGVKMVKETPEDVSLSVLNRLRNKLGVTLNLKSPEARGIFADLLRKADVVVENFSYGTLDRLGCGYEFGRTINPRIVYCSINGFGSEGEPGAARPSTRLFRRSAASCSPPARRTIRRYASEYRWRTWGRLCSVLSVCWPRCIKQSGPGPVSTSTFRCWVR